MPVAPAPGQVVEETKTTRILPDSRAANGEAKPREKLTDIWELVDSLTTQDFLNGDYQFTIYRGNSRQKTEEKIWIGKFQEKLTREEIQRRWGGGEYDVWLKCPPGLQLKYHVDLKIDGAPRADATPAASAAAGDATSQMVAMFRDEMRAMREELRAARGGDLGIEAVRRGMELNGQVFSAAVPAITGAISAAHGTPASGPMDDLTRTFLEAAIQKMMNPADPIEQFAKMMAAMNGLGFGKSSSSSPMVELGKEVISRLPSVAQHFASIMENYRHVEEAKATQAAILRGAAPPQLPPAPAPAPTAPNVVVMPPPAAPPPSPQGMTPDQIVSTIVLKISELLLSDLSAEEAAEKAFDFVEVMDPSMIPVMMQHGEPGLRHLFGNMPVLQQVPPGERVDKFIARILELGKETAPPSA